MQKLFGGMGWRAWHSGSLLGLAFLLAHAAALPLVDLKDVDPRQAVAPPNKGSQAAARAAGGGNAGVALVSVPLQGGGLRRCTGAVLGRRAVLVAAGCVENAQAGSLLQVALPAPRLKKAALAPSPKEDSRRGKKKGRGAMQTRSAEIRAVSPGQEVALLALKSPLTGPAAKPLPIALNDLPRSGHDRSRCRLAAWGASSDASPAPRLTRAEAAVGNRSQCGAGPEQVCARTAGCVPAAGASGGALQCEGRALLGLAEPQRPVLRRSDGARGVSDALHDFCAGGVMRVHPLGRLVPWLKTLVPELLTSGTRPKQHGSRKKRSRRQRRRRRRHAPQ